ncbi:LysM peptidoglycan-binding domain-containing protein [Rossellomorea marisflavi]|uniref:C40 family peptidase n=1 Tax=Rossellomorea marisflavi TaxID=189381 RepID=UPI0027A6C1F1|nr:peptidoglycan endopeptidase [Rossellomorea marisflavi]UTE73353.1 LysM peptidoglycan-binding domain-containing protein [Rossellomorea marisflavi]
MKKTIVTFAATAVLSSTYASAAAASSHKVESGDSLWNIARKYNTSVSNLKSLNNLKSDMIFPNQVLKVTAKASTAPSKPSAPAPSSPAKTYTVKSGDTLIAIANRHSISLGELQKWNGISSHLIYPGQKLSVSSGGSGSSSPAPAPTPSQPSPAPGNSATGSYKVVSGDTLSHISLRYNMSVSELKKLNGLSGNMIYVGQTLKVNGGSSSSPSPTPSPSAPKEDTVTSFDVNRLLSAAKGQMGKPYVWGGSTTAGFDCSGFIYYAFNQAGVSMSRTSSEGYYSRSYYVDKPAIGDIVFFSNTYKKGISHLGIYVGNNQFIHAGDNGVEISSLNNSYWKSKFDSFKRFYSL